MKDSERRPVQQDLFFRTSDRLPFVDDLLVKGAVGTILDQMKQIGDNEGEILYPSPLSGREKSEVLKRIRKNHGNLGFRFGAIYPAPVEDGMGTIFEIREKNKKGRR